jgi:hypothetical protein
MIDQNLRALAHCRLGAERAIRPNLQHQLVVVCILSNARALHIPMPRGVLAALGRLGAALGINVASVLARSVADQCAGSDTVWRACGLAPRCFEPTRNDWIAPQ